MGYHSNEETTKRAVSDACRFINDRARLELALRTALTSLGAPEQQRDAIVADVRAADFRSLHELLPSPAEETGRCTCNDPHQVHHPGCPALRGRVGR